MDEIETTEAAAVHRVTARSPRWTGAPSIDLAHQLNAQCVELICQLAVSNHRAMPAFVLETRDLWRLLEPEARIRVAAFPFVIVDLHFNDDDWWRHVSVKPSTTPLEFSPYEDLTLETLLFARQSARENMNVARAMFAMSSAVPARVASLTLPQVRAIALGHAAELRVRWDNDPELWRDLLVASRAGDSESLQAVRRQAKLLFCGVLIKPRA